jgi:ribosomal protein S18 acetylase RimI-like enzyme
MVEVSQYHVIEADLDDEGHQQAVLNMVRSFAHAVTGEDLPEERQGKLVEGLCVHPAAFVFIALNADVPVGFSVCFLGFSTFMARPVINIHDFYVEKQHRRQGVGRQILDAIESRAGSLDCCKLTLEVEANNQGALSLYQRFGFEEVEYSAEAGLVLFRQKVL